MYGLIGKITIAQGKRDAFSALLSKNTRNMPGCLSYVIANDTHDEDVLWVTEIWTDYEAHRNSLNLPEVQATIAEGREMISGMERVAETNPLQPA